MAPAGKHSVRASDLLPQVGLWQPPLGSAAHVRLCLPHSPLVLMLLSLEAPSLPGFSCDVGSLISLSRTVSQYSSWEKCISDCKCNHIEQKPQKLLPPFVPAHFSQRIRVGETVSSRGPAFPRVLLPEALSSHSARLGFWKSCV